MINNEIKGLKRKVIEMQEKMMSVKKKKKKERERRRLPPANQRYIQLWTSPSATHGLQNTGSARTPHSTEERNKERKLTGETLLEILTRSSGFQEELPLMKQKQSSN